MISLSSYSRISELIDLGVLHTILSILDIYDPDLLQLLLEMLDEIFKFSVFLIKNDSITTENQILDEFKKNNGIVKLENLLQHSNKRIRTKANELLEVLPKVIEKI